MKKISTAAAHEMGKFAGERLTVGLDLGDRSSWCCVLDEAGEVLLERKVATTPKAMKEVFSRMARSRMALETGMHSPWVSRLLRPPSSGDCDNRLAQPPSKDGAEVDKQVAAPTETRTPNLHGAKNRSSKSADGRMAAEAVRSGKVRTKRKLFLTPTGLLMEGVSTLRIVGRPASPSNVQVPVSKIGKQWITGTDIGRS